MSYETKILNSEVKIMEENFNLQYKVLEGLYWARYLLSPYLSPLIASSTDEAPVGGH